MFTRQQIVHGVRWPSIFAGVVVGIVVYLVLVMLAVAIAGFAFHPTTLPELGWGSLMWLLLCNGVAAYIGGRIAADTAPGILPKWSGTYQGLLVGSTLLLTMSVVSVSVLSGAVRAVLGAGESAAGAVGAAVQGNVQQADQVDLAQAARRIGLGQEYDALVATVDRQQLEQEIARAAPELTQSQVASAALVVQRTLQHASSRFLANLQNISQLDNVARRQFNFIESELTGQQLIGNLQQQGLSLPQAREAAVVIEERVLQLVSQAEEALVTMQQQINDLVRVAGDTAARAAWSWLLVAIVLLGFATLGGRQGGDDIQIEEKLEGIGPRYQEDSPEIHHH